MVENLFCFQARKLSATGEQIISTVDPKRTDAIPDIQNNYRREMKPLPDIGKFALFRIRTIFSMSVWNLISKLY